MWARDDAGRHPDAASSLSVFWKSCQRSSMFSVLRESALLCQSQVRVSPSRFPSQAAERRGAWAQGWLRLRGVCSRLNWRAPSPQLCEITFLPKEGISKIWIGFANKAIRVEFPMPWLRHVWGSVLCVVHHAGYQPEQIYLQFFFFRESVLSLLSFMLCSFPQMWKATTVSSRIWLVI